MKKIKEKFEAINAVVRAFGRSKFTYVTEFGQICYRFKVTEEQYKILMFELNISEITTKVKLADGSYEEFSENMYIYPGGYDKAGKPSVLIDSKTLRQLCSIWEVLGAALTKKVNATEKND